MNMRSGRFHPRKTTHNNNDDGNYSPLSKLMYPPRIECLYPHGDYTGRKGVISGAINLPTTACGYALMLDTMGKAVKVHPGNWRLMGRPQPEQSVSHASLATTMLWKISSAKIMYTDTQMAKRSRGNDTW